MDDDRIAEEPTRETVTPTRRTPIGGFCCCGKPYPGTVPGFPGNLERQLLVQVHPPQP